MPYEIFYLIGASKESDVPKIKDNITAMIKDLGGVFEEKETVERRKLSYDIKHERQGVYIAQRFALENTENIKELNTKLNLNQDILRFIISKTDELPELRTKEEREKQFASQDNRKPSVKKEIFSKKTAPQELEKIKESEKIPKKSSAPKEDIDKKLEEILNI